MTHKVTLIKGDGIGPEVADAAVEVINATGVKIDWEEMPAGGEIVNRYGTPLPEETIESIKKNKVALKGPLTTPIGTGFRSINVELRKRLDLFANFRPSRSLKGVKTRYEDVDLIIIRENTEGLYSGLEHVVIPGVVESLRVITEKGSRRILTFAFERHLEIELQKIGLKLSPAKIRESVAQMQASLVEINGKEYLMRSNLEKEAKKILKLLKIKVPQNLSLVNQF